MNLKKILMNITILLLCSCASLDYRTKQNDLKNELVKKNYTGAINIVNKKDFIPEERSELLNKLEKGTTHYLNGDYFQAMQYFTKAQEISDNLYTISLKGKLVGALNANLDNYYGEIYERSLIRFYESLIHYDLYRIGKYESYTSQDEDGNTVVIPEKILTDSEKRTHLMSSKSVIREWDSMLNSYYEKLADKPTYKSDIIAKLFGAFIYEISGNNEDKQIALQLYKDAKTVLFRYYNNYPTFNTKSEDFTKNFKKFPKMNINEIEKKFVNKTEFSTSLIKFIDSKIADLSKNNKDNLIIVLKEGFVSPKIAKIIKIPVPAMYFNLSQQDLFMFTMLLGLDNANGLPLIEFELPYVAEKKINNEIIARISQNGLTIKEFPIIVSNPISDIAYKTFKENELAMTTKTTTSAIVKYSTAFLTAYSIYQQQQDSIGKLAAISSYKLSEKLIKNSLKADTRHWSTLTDNIRVGSTKLKTGNYQLDLYSIQNNIETKVYSQNINITNEQNIIDINL